MSGKPGDLLTELLVGGRHVVLAAPYIKKDALRFILSRVESLASLVCVTRWRPDDLVVGVSDVGCRSIVTESGGSFRLHSDLHAKYYRVDDAVLVGSANLTSSAMGWTSRPNFEILCHAGRDFNASGFEKDLFQNSREINDVEFARWQDVVEIDKSSGRNISSVHPSLDTWRPATRDPRNLMLAYWGQEDEIASIDERSAALRDLQALAIPPGLTDVAFRAWISTCLLATPFANSVMKLSDLDTQRAAAALAAIYGLGVTEARRDKETVENWFSFLALPSSTGKI